MDKFAELLLVNLIVQASMNLLFHGGLIAWLKRQLRDIDKPKHG